MSYYYHRYQNRKYYVLWHQAVTFSRFLHDKEVSSFYKSRIFFYRHFIYCSIYFIWTDYEIFKFIRKERISYYRDYWLPMNTKTPPKTMARLNEKNMTRLKTRMSCVCTCSLKCLWDQFIFSGAFKYLGICVLTFKLCLLPITILNTFILSILGCTHRFNNKHFKYN